MTQLLGILADIDKIVEDPAWVTFGVFGAIGLLGLAVLFLLYPFSRD